VRGARRVYRLPRTLRFAAGFFLAAAFRFGAALRFADAARFAAGRAAARAAFADFALPGFASRNGDGTPSGSGTWKQLRVSETIE
jgi:hypothetical protein